MKSTAVSVACLGCAAASALSIPDALAWSNFVDLANCGWWMLFWLIVRAAWLSPVSPPTTAPALETS